MAIKRNKSRGRDLKHTETQAQLDVTRYVTNERGRTDGRESIGAVSAVSPGLRRKQPSVKRSPNLTAADIARMPADAKVAFNGIGAAKIARYFVDPSTL